MAYTLLNSGRTQFAVDWSVVERFCKSYWLAYYQERYSSLTKISESSWYNPFSWKLPEIQNVDTDWTRVRNATETAVEQDMYEYKKRAAWDMRAIAYDVESKMEQTVALKRSLRDWLREIEKTNLAAMHQAENDYTGLIDTCRFIRDTSADVVAIGSTIATGGAATALLAGSSALKGVYKYQDTGRVGAAVLYGGGSMLLGVFKVGGAKLTTGGEYALVVAQGFLETGTSFASGKSFVEAVTTGGLKIAGAGAAQALFGAGLVKQIFTRMPVPFTVFSETSRLGLEYTAVDVANVLVEKTAKKLVEKSVRAGVPAIAKAVTESSPAPQAAMGSGFIDEVPIEQRGLLYFAIVNMENGIGRGW